MRKDKMSSLWVWLQKNTKPTDVNGYLYISDVDVERASLFLNVTKAQIKSSLPRLGYKSAPESAIHSWKNDPAAREIIEQKERAADLKVPALFVGVVILIVFSFMMWSAGGGSYVADERTTDACSQLGGRISFDGDTCRFR